MRSSSSPDGLTLTDSPGCFWIFGGFFCAIGGAALLSIIFYNGESQSLGQILGVTTLGLAAIAAGIYLIYNAPASRVVISRTRGQLTVSHRGLLRRNQQTFSLNSIGSVYLVQGKDIDGDPVFTLRFQLTGGQELPLTHLWLHNQARLEGTLDVLCEYLPRGETRQAQGK
jgi:hypothetical protein